MRNRYSLAMVLAFTSFLFVYGCGSSSPDGDTTPDGDTSQDGDTGADGDSADGDTGVDGDTSADGDQTADGDTSESAVTCTGDYASLEWQDPASANALTWDEAVTYCQTLDLNGTGWRLPTICELRSLIRGCSSDEVGGPCGVGDGCLEDDCISDCGTGCPNMTGPGTGGCYWPSDLSGSCLYFWSSSEVADNTGAAWYILFSSGRVNRHMKSFYDGVRCVR